MSLPLVKGAVEPLGVERVGSMVTLRYITDRALRQERLTAMFSGFFGALALLLAGIGLFGVMSYAVAQRQREIGIRLALGADPRRVMTGIVGEGLVVTLTGVGIGFCASRVAVQLVTSLLFGVTPPASSPPVRHVVGGSNAAACGLRTFESCQAPITEVHPLSSDLQPSPVPLRC